ncbi:hypothetical protein [Paraburkholderia heleia]|uniref:hypothetical protein n=1 Tax=Paraburkholderia heleia TaxID=634127 RepID=UPI002AB7BEA9|nr:hypothetical protein [Paraburkholderia heleia]
MGIRLAGPRQLKNWRAFAPLFAASSVAKHFGSVRDALAAGPLFFMELMKALGSTDGRKIALELDALNLQGVLRRTQDGEWALEGSADKT